MIPRYQRPDMAAIWSDKYRLQLMFEIEVLVSESMVTMGIIPQDCLNALRKVSPDQICPKRVLELEKITKHETIALLSHIEEMAGPESASFLHFGLTSSDVLDTSFSLQLMRSSDLLLNGINNLCNALKRRAFEHRNTICAGRSHGMHAEPTTFGLKLASFYAEMRRNYSRMATAKENISVGALSGPVGTFASVDPAIESLVCKKLNLTPELTSSQIIPRDRHAEFFSTLALVATSLERLAIEIRHLQRTEIAEVEESFTTSQKGSSAMPHKRNPILSENVTGLARLVRSQLNAALENVVLWHERDMSHSSVERIIAPDATMALDFALHRMTKIIANLKVNTEQMRNNLQLTFGTHFSHCVLLNLIQAGVDRNQAYTLVQRNANRACQEKAEFIDLLGSDIEVTAILPKSKLKLIFDENHFLQYVDTIFERVFGTKNK